MYLELAGRYVSYEYQKIDEETANRILECGLTSRELNEMDFEDGGGWGVVSCYWEVDGEEMSFEFDNKADRILIDAHDGCAIIKEEAGKISYQGRKIKSPYKAELLTFPHYSAELSDYSLRYATPMYDGEELEYDEMNAKEQSLILITPDGDCHTIGSDE